MRGGITVAFIVAYATIPEFFVMLYPVEILGNQIDSIGDRIAIVKNIFLSFRGFSITILPADTS